MVAQAEITLLEAELEALETALRARISGGYEAAVKARARAQTYEAEGLARAELALKQATRGYEEGQLPLTTLMETLRAAQSARQHALEAHLEARLAEIGVRELAAFLPGDLPQTGVRP